ncbi:hypothetical protein EQV77_11165 [Halobacillus fulvus]|nr:hypothetical protein EQV77_11165 [Halobacillus fulvus]
MPMEEGVYTLLIAGFSFFMAMALILTLFLRIRKKRNQSAYNLFIAHFIMFSLAGITLLRTMNITPVTHQSMASEEASLGLAWAGIFWAISIICLLGGIVKIKSVQWAARKGEGVDAENNLD